ncbi:MAG: aspartate 1-decarboxylase, partial [Spirochaetaceae bacterium]|nr:aspartate 1-decarboxylase [Spirochaetaceae bacterium]
MLKSKLHRATVTDANLEYEVSISIDHQHYKSVGIYRSVR